MGFCRFSLCNVHANIASSKIISGTISAMNKTLDEGQTRLHKRLANLM